MSCEDATTSKLVLVADDDPSFRAAFRQMLQMRGYSTEQAETVDSVLKLVKDREYDLLTLDLDWEAENKNGIDILRSVQELDPLLPVIIITGHASIPTAIEATRLGAFDYLEKLVDREKTLLTVKNAIETGRLKRANESFLNEIRGKYEIIGQSAAIREVLGQLQKVGPTDSVVLLTGESGTGKELAARQVHYCSRRRDRKFVSVDSGTLADSLAESELFGHRRGAFTGAMQDRKGLFEEADGGTIFLDEISNASLTLQAKLLHVLQEREYRRLGDNDPRQCDVRIIAASNQDLPHLIEKDTFRQDLYYRLKVVEIILPPLRDRKDDIPLLAAHFLKLKSTQHRGTAMRFSPEAVNVLINYEWPGNVRELENMIERIVIFSEGDEVAAGDLRSLFGNSKVTDGGSMKSLNEMTHEFRRECIIKALNLADGKVAEAANILHIDRTHLYKLIDEYQLRGIR